MDTTKDTNVPAVPGQHSNNGNRRIHMSKHREDSYQSAYEAGLSSGKEAGYRQGYREGFADCCKLGLSARGATGTLEASESVWKETRANVIRLKGLPCAKCHCPSYTGEVRCPRCGAPKAAAVQEQHAAIEE